MTSRTKPNPETRRGRTAARSSSFLLLLATAACGGGQDDRRTEANGVAEDPYGATGAPGADMTDKGINDGASGPADNAAEPLANES